MQKLLVTLLSQKKKFVVLREIFT